MRYKIKNLVGNVYSRLTVISFHSIGFANYHGASWNCQCQCGNVVTIRSCSLGSGLTKSCGCLQTDLLKTHGGTKTKEFRVWMQMKARCKNPKDKAYKDYGGRGIKVCERWREFGDFIADMGKCPAGRSLDRINNNGDYEPGNCRWATKKEQANNTRQTKMIEYKGRTMALRYWCDELNLNHAKTRIRIFQHGWTVERAFTS